MDLYKICHLWSALLGSNSEVRLIFTCELRTFINKLEQIAMYPTSFSVWKSKPLCFVQITEVTLRRQNVSDPNFFRSLMNKMAASVETGSSLNLTTSATISHHLHHYQQLALVRRGGGEACAPDAARPPGRRAAAAAGQQALALAHSLTVIGQQLSAQQLSASTHLVGAELSSQQLSSQPMGQQLSSPHHMSQQHNLSQQLSSPHHMSQQISSPHHMSQQLSSPHHMSQQLSSPHHMSQQLSSPHHLSQQLSSPHHMSQQLSSPHHMSQQLSSPHHISQQLSSPHHISQQLSSPHHMSQQLSSPNHQLSSLYHMARQQTATQQHMALHSSHTNLIGFSAGVRLGGTSAANWPATEETVSAMTRSVAALVSPTRLGPAAAAVGLLPDAFMPKFSQHLARILENEQRQQQQQEQQQGQASPFYHNYSPKRKLYNLQSNPELHKQTQLQNPAVLQPLQPKLLLQDVRAAFSPKQQQLVHLQQQQSAEQQQQPASRLQQQGLQEQKGKLQLAAPQQPRNVVVHKYSSFKMLDLPWVLCLSVCD
jgi:hypothetical protein